MVDESVLGLSPVATAILEAVPEGVGVGLPTVTQQVWDLVAHKVLVVAEDGWPRDGTAPPFNQREEDPRHG